MGSIREKHKISKAIIPAAGLGTRMEPITKVIPKEMLPLGRKPVLEYIIEELQAGGIEEILIVTRADKPAIQAYFKSWDGIDFIEENHARGSGYAVLMGKSFVGEENCLVALADAPIWEDEPGKLTTDLIHTHMKRKATITMAIYQIPWEETHLRGVMDLKGKVTPGKAVKIKDMIEKPPRETAPSNWAGVGRYAFSPDIFTALEAVSPDEKGEVQLTEGIRWLVQEGKPFYGYPLQEGQTRFDTGNSKGYLEASGFFAEGVIRKS
jgi:UTP--glucose-1-phosphate uridylyltransferase